LKVLKFGGTSVGSVDKINLVLDIIESKLSENLRAVVFSAYSGVTDELYRLANKAKIRDSQYIGYYKKFVEKHVGIATELTFSDKELCDKLLHQLEFIFSELKELLDGVYLLRELSPKSLDFILSTGERLSCQTITAALNLRGINSNYCDTRTLIKSDNNFNDAKVLKSLTYDNINLHFSNDNSLQICTGFIASTIDEETTTLGRGGSDYSASIIAAALNVSELEIWTDVDGVMTTDPRRVQNAKIIPDLSYSETMELSFFGAKVIYAPTIQPVQEKKIPIIIKNTFASNNVGTRISNAYSNFNQEITGIACIDHLALIRVDGPGLVGAIGFAARLFSCLAEDKINLIMISQASSEHSICFAVLQSEAGRAEKAILREFKKESVRGDIEGVFIDDEVSIIAIVGENMRNKPGISGKIFEVLGRRNINISAIAQGSSELNISFIVKKDDTDEALNAIHHSFFDNHKTSIYLAGPGKIGKELIKLIIGNPELNTHIRISGIINSQRMKLGNNRSDINWIEDQPEDIANINKFIHTIRDDITQRKIFVDTTNSENIPDFYNDIILAGADIVSANKVLNSSRQIEYDGIRSQLKIMNRTFRYETNVGAALPIIETINNLVRSGDQIHKIEGILSGSVNFLLTELHLGRDFEEIVKEAVSLGITEPDPRVDFSGKDVARKILILGREAGAEAELSEVVVQPLITDNTNLSVSQLMDLIEKARKLDYRIKYVATYENNKMEVKLVEVDSNHPFYYVNGLNNSVIIYSKFYKDSPLSITGYGAGIELTASGVLADILSIIRGS